MSNESLTLANPENKVVYNRQIASVLARSKGYLILIVGSDNEDTGKVFQELAARRRYFVNFRGLEITDDNSILAISNLTEDTGLVSKLNDILKDESRCMPSNFDFENRAAIRMNGEKHIRVTYAAPMKYFKFHVSIIGNPKHILMFKIRPDVYKSSDFYKQFIANQSYAN